MTSLLHVLQIISGDQISGGLTTRVDAALSVADVNDIPEVYTKDVVDYIDVQLLHNCVSQEVRLGLERLQSSLRSRNERATR